LSGYLVVRNARMEHILSDEGLRYYLNQIAT